MKDLAVALAATLAVQSVSAITVYTPAVLAPVATAEIGVAPGAIGLFTALIYALATLSAPVGGTHVARQGAVRVSQACLLLGGLGLAAAVYAHPAAAMLAAVLIGMGYGPITPASSALLVERTPPRLRNLIMSIRQTGVPVGGAFAGAVVPGLMLAMGWRGAALAMAGLCVALAVLLQAIRPRYDHPHPGGGSARPSFIALVRMVATHRPLLRVSVASFTYAGMQMCYTTFLVVFLTERAGMSVVSAGLVLSAAMLAGIVGRVGWGVLADVVGSARKVLSALGVLMAACAFTLPHVTAGWPFAAVIGLCMVYGATAIGWNGVYIAEVARIAPDGEVALATGASLAFTYFGVVVAPFVFWIIIAATGSYGVAYGLIGAGTLASSIGFLSRMSPSR